MSLLGETKSVFYLSLKLSLSVKNTVLHTHTWELPISIKVFGFDQLGKQSWVGKIE